MGVQRLAVIYPVEEQESEENSSRGEEDGARVDVTEDGDIGASKVSDVGQDFGAMNVIDVRASAVSDVGEHGARRVLDVGQDVEAVDGVSDQALDENND